MDTRSSGFLARELDEIEASYPRVLRPDVFTLDAARYRASVGTLAGGGSPGGEGAYFTLVGLAGQYDSNVGLQGMAAELGEPYPTFRERVTRGELRAEGLPGGLTTLLAPRDKLVCAFREVVRQIVPGGTFCAKTFEAAEVKDSCPPPVAAADAGDDDDDD